MRRVSVSVPPRLRRPAGRAAGPFLLRSIHIFLGLRLPLHPSTFILSTLKIGTAIQNCRKSSSPPLEPPPLTHKSGVTTASLPVPVPVPVPVMAPVPRRVPVPVPVPVPGKVPRDKRVLLRMKVAGGTPDGERVWAVAGGPAGAPPAAPGPPAPAPAPAPVPPAPSRARAPRPALPQGLAVLNGRRFVVVPRNMVHATHAAK
ncbi:hypothetical protein B5X24_HaOG206873 [Helicoverpa armigera]|uniref:Uncharacterized protein n=1 Tax=Helicoverpa armigera TaxID=29058 RepID=A0A2W1BL13_HELAM|nr:hypothetical protein B5X24_HaOG206873 [Helicoverpa armigera]